MAGQRQDFGNHAPIARHSTPITEYPTPNVADLIVIEDITRPAEYRPILPGTPRANDSSLFLLGEREIEGNNHEVFIRRAWSSRRHGEDSFNGALSYLDKGHPSYPVFVRNYTIRRADYVALTAAVTLKSVVSITVTAGGSGYTPDGQLALTISGTGTLATAVCEVRGGVIVSAAITNGGDNYTTNPTVSVTTPGGGTGATFSAQVQPQTAYLVKQEAVPAANIRLPHLDGQGATVNQSALFYDVTRVWFTLPGPYIPFTRYDVFLGPIQGRRRLVLNTGQAASLTATVKTTYDEYDGSSIVAWEVTETNSDGTGSAGNPAYLSRTEYLHDEDRGNYTRISVIVTATVAAAATDDGLVISGGGTVATFTEYKSYEPNPYFNLKVTESWALPGPSNPSQKPDQDGMVLTTTKTLKLRSAITAGETIVAGVTATATATATPYVPPTGDVVLTGDAVSSITITSGGTGTIAGYISIFSSGGSGATATPVYTAGVLTSVIITNGGSGYSDGDATAFFGATEYGHITAITVTDGGGPYIAVPSVTIGGTYGGGATATAVVTNFAVTGITVTAPGNGYGYPSGPILVTIADPTGSTWKRTSLEDRPEGTAIATEVVETRTIPGNAIPAQRPDDDGILLTVTRRLKAISAVSTEEVVSGGVWTRTLTEPLTELVCWQVTETRAIPGPAIKTTEDDVQLGIPVTLTQQQVATSTIPSTNALLLAELLALPAGSTLEYKPIDSVRSRKIVRTIPIPSFSLTGGATTNGSANITVASTASLCIGATISGTGIPAGAFVLSITNTTVFVLSANATATNSSLTLTAGYRANTHVEIDYPYGDNVSYPRITENSVVDVVSFTALPRGTAHLTTYTSAVLTSDKLRPVGGGFTDVNYGLRVRVYETIPALSDSAAKSFGYTVERPYGLVLFPRVTWKVPCGTESAETPLSNSFPCPIANYNTAAFGNTTSLTSCVTNGTATVTCASTAALYVGAVLSGTDITAGTSVSSITNSTTFVMSAVATGSHSGLTLAAAYFLTLIGQTYQRVNGQIVSSERIYEANPGPTIVESDDEPRTGTVVRVTKQIVAQAGIPATAALMTAEKVALGAGVKIEYKPLGMDALRSIRIVSATDAASIAWNGTTDNDKVYYGTKDWRFLDELIAAGFYYEWASAGGSFDFDVALYAKIKEGYSGACICRITERRTTTPSDAGFVAALPSITAFRAEAVAVPTVYAYAGTNLFAKARTFTIPATLHGSISIAADHGSAPSGSDITGASFSPITATSITTVTSGNYYLVAIVPEREDFGYWLFRFIEVKAP